MSDKPDISSLRIDRSQKFDDRPRSGAWKWIVGIVVVAVLVSAYFWIMPRLTPATKVDVTTVRMIGGSDAAAELVATGYVVAQRSAEVASKGTGRLVWLGYEEGDTVNANAVIARLDNEDVLAQLDFARAELAGAEVDTLDAGRAYRRDRTLLESGAVTEDIVEGAEARYLGALTGIDRARASIRAAEVELENTVIRAPFTGTVLTKNADVGEIVAPFASSANSKGSVVTLADMNSLEVEADVAEANFVKVAVGQRCEIILDAYPDVRYQGFVKKIVPTADRARATVQTKIAFVDKDDRVLPEMSARVNFFIDAPTEVAPRQALVVDQGAITRRDGRQVVFRIEGEVVTLVDVTIGRDFDDNVEILAGLQRGDRVVLDPPGKMTSGQKVDASR